MEDATGTSSTAAQRLAGWALSLKLSDIDAAVLARVKLHILDQIGAQIGCRGLATPRLVHDYVSRYGRPGGATVLGTPLQLDAEAAGFANATTGSSFEIDDYGYGAHAHPGCVVVPAALAVCEEAGASGADMLLASTAGFETVIRIALASMPSMLLDRGFHQTGAHGVFAAALTTCMIEQDVLETVVHALAVAGSHASGTTEYGQTGGEVKRAHAGIGVAGGIRSARLARMGLTGPSGIFEGRRGFLQAFCNTYEERPLYDDLGDRWHFRERGAIKPYASCGLVHQHFAAYDKLAARHSFAAADIDSVVLGCDPLTLVHTGSIGPRPVDLVGAQFSAEYGMGMRILGSRNDTAAYLEAEQGGFSDPEVLAMAARVRLELDAECAAGFPRSWLGRVTLRLRNGDILSDTGYPLGSPLNPMDQGDIEEKYLGLVTRELGSKVAEQTMELIMCLEDVSDVREITGLLACR